jgi:hypothetical protein
VLGLSFSPLVQRSGMDHGRLGLGTGVPSLEALPGLLAQGLAAVRRDAPAAGPSGSAAECVAREIAELAARRPQGLRP